MSEGFLADLALRLDAYGVRGADAERVLSEARDHLAEAAREGGDPARRFGDADSFARLVAAELATATTRRATFLSFGALALAGTAYALVLALVPVAGGWGDIFGGRIEALGPFLAVATVLLPQVAFVSGSLALLRMLRLRRAAVVRDAELRLVRRRNAFALATGGATLGVLAVYALDFQGELAGWWTWSTVASCVFLSLPLGAAGVAVARSGRPAAASGGEAGDVLDDLAAISELAPIQRLGLREHPWRLAGLAAGAVGIVGFVGGWYAEGDPGSGIVRGGFEAVALLICFAALGRLLGLRRSKT